MGNKQLQYPQEQQTNGSSDVSNNYYISTVLNCRKSTLDMLTALELGILIA